MYSVVKIIDPSPLPQAKDNIIKVALTDVFVLLGAVALLMVVIGGFRYITARGNADATAQAKGMITHALIGLIVAALAATIVNVVLGKAG